MTRTCVDCGAAYGSARSRSPRCEGCRSAKVGEVYAGWRVVNPNVGRYQEHILVALACETCCAERVVKAWTLKNAIKRCQNCLIRERAPNVQANRKAASRRRREEIASLIAAAAAVPPPDVTKRRAAAKRWKDANPEYRKRHARNERARVASMTPAERAAKHAKETACRRNRRALADEARRVLAEAAAFDAFILSLFPPDDPNEAT